VSEFVVCVYQTTSTERDSCRGEVRAVHGMPFCAVQEPVVLQFGRTSDAGDVVKAGVCNP